MPGRQLSEQCLYLRRERRVPAGPPLNKEGRALAYITMWSQVEAGDTVLINDSYVVIDRIDGPVNDQVIIHGTFQESGARRMWNRRGSSLVAVPLSIEDKAAITDFFRRVGYGQ